MASRSLQPSEYEIQREVEALRDIRRRSTTPLTIDPDLPNQSPPSSPTSAYWSPSSPAALSQKDVHPSDSSSDASSSFHRSNSTRSRTSTDATSNPTDDPFHLFWVPASLHPEIAPAEFRAFLKEHARTPLPGEDPEHEQLERAPSAASHSSSGLGRKRSMLSRQYRPAENDGVEDESVVSLKRNRSSMYSNRGPQLTINDLQKLEELAEEASESDDPSRLRNVLRRSLSLNMSPSALEQMDDMPEMGDEADAPIIVPPPGQILRRAARTKIRKPGLPGDGGGHRFGASRRGHPPQGHSSSEPRISSDVSSSDHGEPEQSGSVRPQTFSDDGTYAGNQRPDSFSEESSIYDAYARDEDEEIISPIVVTAPPPSTAPEVPPEAISPVIYHPQPQRLLTPQPTPDLLRPLRTPSPSDTSSINAPSDTSAAAYTPPSPPSIQTPSPPSSSRKEKDKKGLFKWGSDKTGKKGSKEKEKDRESRERANAEKDKDSGFFGSLFGKKKQDSEYIAPLGAHGPNAGREAAQALLGASKSSKSYVPPSSPGLASPVGPNSYARYPIHVERAIYRLSHIKLANPRRPLYEQVLISNLMFWYLGIINKAQNPSPPPTAQSSANSAAPAAGAAGNVSEAQIAAEKEESENEQREREQRERIEKERAEKERLEKEQRDRELEMKKKESGRRGSLTKTPAGGAPGGGRRAEMPIKGPQYEMQHRVMEQEYGGYNGPAQQPMPVGRPSPPGGIPGQQYPRMQQQQQQPPQQPQYSNPAPKLVHQQMQPPEHYYYHPEQQLPQQQQHQQQRLPPGAMPPIDQSSWISQQPPSSTVKNPTLPMNPGHPPPPHQRRSRSPPPRNHSQQQPRLYNLNTSQESLGGAAGQRPGRSLSATAVSPPPLPQVNGKVRKGHSAQAAPNYARRPHTSEGQPMNGTGEEEDVPLAVWQQRRK